MKFRSTRGAAQACSFSEALLRGLAEDGGLYVPESMPQLGPGAALDSSGLLSLGKIANPIVAAFLQGDALDGTAARLCEDALDFPTPLRRLDERTSVLELFHGPTAAFKDVGARFLAACMSRLTDDEAPRTILVATSGDTGGAIASAFHRRPGVRVIVLFPENGVSPRQRHQLTCWGDNIRSFAVAGVFDDCQRMVKAAFQDEAWRRRVRLTSANSINIGRLLPQTTYYAYAALRYFHETERPARFVVPSGNVGNACAAIWAKEMGYPIEHIALTSNANRPVADYFSTGDWSPRPSLATLANAMDVGDPSNMERVRALYPNAADLKPFATAHVVSDVTIQARIRDGFDRWGEIFCPHTATALDFHLKQQDDAILVATAHPAKFESVVEPIIGRQVPMPAALAELMERPSHEEPLSPDVEALKAAIDSA